MRLCAAILVAILMNREGKAHCRGILRPGAKVLLLEWLLHGR